MRSVPLPCRRRWWGILPTETGFFSRKEQKEHWRLACQTKVKEDMQVIVPESVFGVKEWECEVVSNRNVSTFIKEFVVKLPEGEVMNFQSGSYRTDHHPSPTTSSMPTTTSMRSSVATGITSICGA